MKSKIFALITALLFNALMGGILASFASISPIGGAIGMNVIGLTASGFMPQGSLIAGVYTEVWTGELVKRFSHADAATWLDGVPDYSQYAENDVIHLVDIGIDPDVLINNTTYPIPLQALGDTDIPIGLDKFVTKVTPVTDDELHAISYDKISSVIERHGNAITETKHDKALHAFAPAANTASTPIVFTSGEELDGKMMITRADIIKMKKAFDDLKIPLQGRRLVLCNDHVQHLLLVDQKFAQQYYNYTTGKIANLYGFEVYEYVANPLYNQLGAKQSFGAIEGDGVYQASVAFYTKDMFKASGTTKMYYSEADTDPEYQRNKVNFRHYFIGMPKKQRGIGAIVTKKAA